MRQKALGRLYGILGPGILFAAAAIGVSHLVQSTRAGAGWGFALVWVVLVANLLKYPFFEYGPRYAAASGESLLEGYARLGRWAVALYLYSYEYSRAETLARANQRGIWASEFEAPWAWRKERRQ